LVRQRMLPEILGCEQAIVRRPRSSFFPDSFFTVEKTTGARTRMHNQKAIVAVAVEREVKSDGPQATHIPDSVVITRLTKLKTFNALARKKPKSWLCGHLFSRIEWRHKWFPRFQP